MRVIRLLPLAFAVLALSACGGDDAYVADNERLLESLPTPPRAERVRVTSAPYYKYESNIVEGYTTNAMYRAPAETTDEDVIRFYIDALGASWEHCRDEIGIMNPVPAGATPPPPLGKVLLASFIRDGATLGINTDGLNPVTYTGTYEIGVDHNAREDPCTGEDLR
jgi:hypothetical protein